MSDKQTPLEELIGLLDLEQIEENLFRGFHPSGRMHRLFGGQIIAQALVSAARTVPEDRPVHSVHAYFLRPGDPTTPAIFEVERIRDGRSFTTRRIVVIQNGQAIFNMDASFHVTEAGLSHSIPMPTLTPPDEDSLTPEMLNRPFISVRVSGSAVAGYKEPAQFIWLKSNGAVAANPMLHTALLSYESDSALLGTARLPHWQDVHRKKMQVASLDHSIWFHRPVKVDEWLLYSLESPSAGHARGFSRGTIHSADGILVANCIQEGLIRVRD